MKNGVPRKPLTLKKEVLRTLSATDLSRVNGGAESRDSCMSQCSICETDCFDCGSEPNLCMAQNDGNAAGNNFDGNDGAFDQASLGDTFGDLGGFGNFGDA